MTKRKESNIIPMHRNKFYVYALFKPNEANPFYVGKGIGEGLTCSQVVELTGIGRTTYHRIKKKMKNKQIEQFNTCEQSCQPPN